MARDEAAYADGLRPWRAILLAWLVEGTISAVYIQLAGSTLHRARVQWFNALEYVALGFLGYLAVKLWLRFGPSHSWLTVAALLAAGNALGWLALPDDLTNFSERQSDSLPVWVTLTIGVTLVASSLALVWWVGRRLNRRWAAWAVVPALAVLIGNRILVPPDYHGIRAFLTLSAVTFAAVALVGTALGSRLNRIVERLLAVRGAPNALLGLGCLSTAILLVVPPAGSVRVAWMQSSSAPLFRAVSRVRGALELRGDMKVSQQTGEWFVDRSTGSVPPTKGFNLANPIVLMITIDALRADLVGGQYDERLPTLAKLRKESLWFSNARAPGTLTKTSVASLFMGKYFSQQYWVKAKRGLYAVTSDATRRFPEYLTAAGVSTLNINAVGWLRNENGQVKGFAKEKRITSKKHGRYTPSKPVIDYFVKRLRKVDEHPLFIHTHLIDAHAPYTLGGTKGSQFDRYLAEVALVDEGLSRVLRAIERHHLEPRTFVIVLADHGEAFGEHGASTHGTNVYDEVLHVPLMIRGPDVQARKVNDLVTTMDVGPTILDLFRQPVPRYFMGQSLLPYMLGQSPHLTRPVLGEARLTRTLVMPNGLKVIYDIRTRQVELYDLAKDPRELQDLSDDRDLIEEPLGLLQRFFEVHGYHENGYSPPFVR